MNEALDILRDRCRELIIKINILENLQHASLPLARYILSVPYALPIEHIVLAERPYATDIFPYAASAMSYDASLNMNATPIVHFLALDISNATSLDYGTCKEWFRDSWKYLHRGILLLNVCTTYSFMDNRSEKERVAMEEFIRDIISVSLKLMSRKIHIYALGNPARHSAGRIRSSIIEDKNRVTIHESKNPAGFKHKLGDTMSPNFTIGAKALTKLFAGLILSTTGCNDSLTEEDYFKMATEDPDYRKLINRSNSTGESFKAIAAYFKANDGRMIERNDELFDRAAQEMREFVLALSAVKIKTLFAQINEPPGASKPAYFSRRTDYNKAQYSRGSSSRASAQTPGKKQSIGFADDDNSQEQSTPVSTVESDSGISTPRSNMPHTPINPRYAGSVGGQSSATRRTTNIGFAESDDEDTIPEESEHTGTTISFNDNISDNEMVDLSYVSDFIDPSNDDYNVEPAIGEFLQEAIRTKRAISDVSKEVVTIIRETRADSKQRSIANALGMEGGIIDMPHPIMQWVLKNVVN